VHGGKGQRQREESKKNKEVIGEQKDSLTNWWGLQKLSGQIRGGKDKRNNGRPTRGKMKKINVSVQN